MVNKKSLIIFILLVNLINILSVNADNKKYDISQLLVPSKIGQSDFENYDSNSKILNNQFKNMR